MIQQTLKKLDFSEDEISVYLSLIENSPTSVRSIATDTAVGRGTVFNILKKFITQGVANYYRKGKTKLFTAADPKALQVTLERKKQEIELQEQEVEKVIPELRSFFSAKGRKTKVRYYEGTKEVSEMLRDVIETMKQEKNKEYYVYSTKGKRQIIYTDFPDFSDQRIKAGISVKAIAICKGGELRGLDERKWLLEDYDDADSSYMVIYGDKISFVTLDAKDDPVGVIIEDKASTKIQKLIFDKLWESL